MEHNILINSNLALTYMLVMIACMVVGSVTVAALYRPRKELPAIIVAVVVSAIAYTSWSSQTLVAGFWVAVLFNMAVPFLGVAIARSPQALAK